MKMMQQLNKRTLIFLSIAVVLLLVIVCDQLSFNPLNSSSGNLNEELALKKSLFVKYNSVISKRELYEKQLLELKDTYSSLDTKFIKSKTEDLAQAQLQDFVKGVARKSGLIISRSSAQNVEILNDEPPLLLVYARVEIKEIDKIKKLQKFLYNIEYNNQKLIFVDDLKIKSTGFTTTKGVSAIIKLFAIAKLEAKKSDKTAGLQAGDSNIKS
ncbi:MAG: hypothetical protein HN402_08650 [Candidatus Scalindua sp.]|nr:hypothetical protein [Candidatus Scalindua sp.]